MRKLKINEKEFSGVLLSHGETEPEKYAANELKKYFEKIGIATTGGVSVRVAINPSLARESVSVRRSEDGLVIEGGNGRGVIYAVYTFLERYAGMRFFMPGLETLGEGDVCVDSDYSYTSPFEMRQIDWHCGNDSLDWRLKNKVNRGAAPENMGGGITYAEHPEYYSEIKGKRVVERSQLCLTNPDVLRIATAEIRKRIQEHPEAMIFSVSQNDWRNYCTCEKCAAIDFEEGSHAGTLLRFVNAVAEDIAEDYPNVVIDTLAYQYTRKAPAITKPRVNVCVRLCSIECCFSHPLDDPACEENAAFYRDILEWNKICDRIYICHSGRNCHALYRISVVVCKYIFRPVFICFFLSIRTKMIYSFTQRMQEK